MKDENSLYNEWKLSPHAGVAQGPGREPSPVGNFPAGKLPQAGEGLHGEPMSSLPSLLEDFDTSRVDVILPTPAPERQSPLETLPESESALDIFNQKFGGGR